MPRRGYSSRDGFTATTDAPPGAWTSYTPVGSGRLSTIFSPAVKRSDTESTRTGAPRRVMTTVTSESSPAPRRQRTGSPPGTMASPFTAARASVRPAESQSNRPPHRAPKASEPTPPRTRQRQKPDAPTITVRRGDSRPTIALRLSRRRPRRVSSATQSPAGTSSATSSGGKLSHAAAERGPATGDGGALVGYQSALPSAGGDNSASAPLVAVRGGPNTAVSPCRTTSGASRMMVRIS